MNESFVQLIATGYEVRPATYADLPQMVAMVNAAEVEQVGAGDWTVERYREEWRQTGIDLAASTRLVVAPDESIVGCVEVWDHYNPPVWTWIWGRVHPQCEGQGIGSALLAWALTTSMRAIDRLPEGTRPVAHVAGPSAHQPSIELFESMGMSVCRYSWRMIIDLAAPGPEPQWPAGFLIRTLRYPEDLEAVYRVQDEAFREHWGYVERPFEEAFELWKRYSFAAMELKPELWFLALVGDRIVGFINSQERSPEDTRMGWIPTLGVLPAYRRRGLGRALLLHAFRALQQRGVPAVGLGVDATNKTGATRLYQDVGMRVQHEIVHYELVLRPGQELAVVD